MCGEQAERSKAILDEAIVRFLDELRIIAFGILRDWELAEVVVDQTVVDVLRRKPKLRSLEKARRYLVRAVRNRALNRRKSEARRGAVHVSIDEEQPSSLPPLLVSRSVEADAIAAQTEKLREAALRKALASLTRKQGEVWDRLCQGMDYEDIADELGISVEAVAARKQRLIERLRQFFVDVRESS